MNPDPPPNSSVAPDLVAICIVVDSSWVVADEWTYLLFNCVNKLILRLTENYSPQKNNFRTAFVCYGTSDTYPSPIVSSRFFTAPSYLMKEMKDESGLMGIGQTGTGGDTGMAVLEGLVAGLEMFDTLLETYRVRPLTAFSLNTPFTEAAARPPVTHLFHIAAGQPDRSPRPMWNAAPQLDDVSMSTLGAEIKKRNIHYSPILLRGVPQLTELRSAASLSPHTIPWFEYPPHHAVLLSGFPEPDKAQNRAAETGSPEIKREKPSPNPPAQPPRPPSAVTPTPAPRQPTPVASVVPPAAPDPVPAPASALTAEQQKIIAMFKRFRALELEIVTKEAQHRQANEQGRVADANALMQDLEQKRLLREQFGRFISQNQAQLQALRNTVVQNAAAHNAGAAAASNPPGAMPAPTAPMVPPGVPAAQQGQPLAAPGAGPVMHRRTPSNGSSAVPPPHLATQMAKMLEQKNKAALPQAPAPQVSQPHHMQPTPQARQPAPVLPSIWRGTFSWTGVDANISQKKEVRAEVLGRSELHNILPHTWPAMLTLTPAGPAVQANELREWIRQQAAIPIIFNEEARTIDPSANTSSFKSLHTLLIEKNLYAVAAWQRPDGQRGNNLLIFAFNNEGGSGIIGAALPTTGLPGLPQKVVGALQSAPAPMAGPATTSQATPTPEMSRPDISKLDTSKLPPALIAQLSALPPAQREQAFRAWLYKTRLRAMEQQQQQRQAQAQSQAQAQAQIQAQVQAQAQMQMAGQEAFDLQGDVFAGTGGMNLAGAPGFPQGMGMPSTQAGFQPRQMGNMTGPVSNEILQAFMQRGDPSRMGPG